MASEKLSNLNSQLKAWIKNTFGDVSKRQEDLLQIIQDLDKQEASIGLSEQLRLQQNHARHKFQELVIQDEVTWCQKLRINWLCNGDQNTKFFHSLANRRMNYNQISSLLMDGKECDDFAKIESKILNYYKGIYSKTNGIAAWFSSWTGKSISQQQAANLEKSFKEEEIKQAIFSLAGDKA